MVYRDLLLLLDDSRGAAQRITATAEFAKRTGAGINAIYLGVHHQIPSYAAAEISAQVLETRDQAIKEQAEASKEAFMQACSAAGVAGRFSCLVDSPGELADAAMAAGRIADVVVLGQPDEAEGGWMGPWLLESILLGCGRPVLVVPYIGAHERIGSKVLVGWDGGREAARAVGDSLPLLLQASEVTVLSVNREPDAKRPSTEEITAHLVRHGVPAKHHDVKIEALSAANYMLNRASDEGADLIVMGAYAHSRLRELILGGMTRDILKHMTVPVLLSH